MMNKIKELEDMAMWLRDEVMDEDNWELNAVALGEVICRKLVRCGLLEMKDGNYHILNAFDTIPIERTGRWIKKEVRMSEIEGSECFVYGNVLYIKTIATRDGSCDNRKISCVDLENGYVCWFEDDDVTPVNAKVVVE